MSAQTVQPDTRHPWDRLRATPTCWKVGGQVYHESLLRSFRVLGYVGEMVARGDSKETVLAFLRFMDMLGAPQTDALECPDTHARETISDLAEEVRAALTRVYETRKVLAALVDQVKRAGAIDDHGHLLIHLKALDDAEKLLAPQERT